MSGSETVRPGAPTPFENGVPALRARLAATLGGRYRVGDVIGQGANAVVFHATDLRHGGRAVALKILKPEVAAYLGVDRFLREIELAGQLQHPNIVPLYDSGAIDGLPYFVMPLVDGLRLYDRLLKENQLSVDEALRIARAVARALDYAHSKGIVHRDIKPENILLSGEQVLVADFGLARAFSEAGGERLTRSGVAVGTPAYMSPEQINASGTIDGRSDVYALGCLLFELLAGEPPFSGRSIQTILARHLAEPPPSLQVLRPGLPGPVARSVNRALAKVPADRFPTAGAFVEALTGPDVPEAVAAGQWRRLVLVGALVVGALAAAVPGIRWIRLRMLAPSPNRVIVFPLRETAGDGGTISGEDVAAYVGYALEGTEPLRWEEGRTWFTAKERAEPGVVTEARQREIARRRGARFFIDGAILRSPDSVTVVLSLYDALGDSLVRRKGRSAEPGSSEAQLGALAVGDLIPALVEPGRRVDVTPLSRRRPSAIAHFVLGEREYRRTHFAQALGFYEAAVREDSAFAMAALKGAQAASWTEQYDRAEELADIAVSHDTLLPPRYRNLIRGLSFYFQGSGDSAVAALERAIALEPAWSEAWMALGEAHYHLLPGRSPADSLAEFAFERASSVDSGFAPPLFHLAQLGIRRQAPDVADRYRRRFRAIEPDTTLSLQLDLMLGCARGSMKAADWNRTAQSGYPDVLDVARLLAPVPAYGACAERAYQAVLAESSDRTHRFAALLGLQSLLLAQGRTQELRTLLGSPMGDSLGGKWFYLLNAAAGAGAPNDSGAAQVAAEAGTDYARMSTFRLWVIGVFEASRGTAEPAGAISRALRAKADSSAGALDQLLARILEAHAALAAGDSAVALARFAALHPAARRNELAWSLWAHLGLERLRESQLLLALGRAAAAQQAAARLDAPQPAAYLLYLPASLEVRARAAESLGQESVRRRFERQLAAFRAEAE